MFAIKTVLSLVILAATLLVAAAPATAMPAECATARDIGSFNSGVTLGRLITRQAWNRVGQDPDRFEEAAAAVRAAVSGAIAGLPSEATSFVRCRAAGISQGVCDQLGIIQGGIVGQCVLDGEMWGVLSAQIYCDLAIAFEGQDVFDLIPTAPTTLCGESFEGACRGEFDEAAEADAVCLEYTEDPFLLEYASWKAGLCAYEL
jgi:hypothetical protein